MENWATAGVFLAKLLANVSKETSQGRAYEQDIRMVVQEEMRKTQSKEQMEFLRDVIQLMEERKKDEKQEEETRRLQAQVEELTRKLDRLDRNKKVQENREWLKGMFEKMSDSKAGGGQQPRQHSRGRKPNRQNHGPQNSNDHLPWMDGPKSGPNTFQKGQSVTKDESFVMVNAQDCSFNSRGRGNYRGGRGQYPRSNSQNRGNDQQSTQLGNAFRGNGNQQHRGNFRGRGRGAIPKNSAGGRAPNEGEMMSLNAKLENLSTTDVQVSLSPQEIITIKNALQSNRNSGKQPTGKNIQGDHHSSGGRQQTQQSAGRAHHDARPNWGGARQQRGQRGYHHGGQRRQQDQQDEEPCSLM